MNLVDDVQQGEGIRIGRWTMVNSPSSANVEYERSPPLHEVRFERGYHIGQWTLLVPSANFQGVQFLMSTDLDVKPAVSFGWRALEDRDDTEKILADTDIACSTSDLAQMLDTFSRPAVPDDVQLNFDPDEHPLF